MNARALVIGGILLASLAGCHGEVTPVRDPEEPKRENPPDDPPVDLPSIACDTSWVDFGQVMAGATRTIEVPCHSEEDEALLIEVSAPEGDGADGFEASVRQVEIAAAGDALVPISFRPGVAGQWGAHVDLGAEGFVLHTVFLRGVGVDEEFRIEPEGGVSFGMVPLGAPRERTIRLINAGSREIHVDAFDVAEAAASEFSIDIAGPVVLPPFSETPVTVGFAPLHGGTRTTFIDLRGDDAALAGARIWASGIGHGAELQCDTGIDFGPVPDGIERSRSFRCFNAGYALDPRFAPLRITGVSSSSPSLLVSVRGGLPPEGYGPGEAFFVDVTFLPTSPGSLEGVILVESAAAWNGIAEVKVRGSRSSLPPCVLTATPSWMDFGVVAPTRSLTLPTRFANQADERCLVDDLRVHGDSSFSIDVPGDFELPPMGVLDVDVTFGPAVGEAKATLEDGAGALAQLRAVGMLPCLDFGDLDELVFGEVDTSGGGLSLDAAAFVACASLTLGSVEIGAGPGAEAFAIESAPDALVEMTVASFGVRFQPVAPGDHRGSLVVRSTGGTYRVPLRGTGTADPLHE